MTCARATVTWQTWIWTTRYANTSPHCQALPRRLEPPAPVHRRVPRCRPVRVVGAVNYQPHPDTGSKVVLTIVHVWDKRPEQASLLNLAALCQRCHLNWDRREHGFNRLRNRIARLMRQGQVPLCLPREDSLAMALYDELVRRGEISMPPQRVMQLGFPDSAYEWVGSRPR